MEKTGRIAKNSNTFIIMLMYVQVFVFLIRLPLCYIIKMRRGHYTVFDCICVSLAINIAHNFTLF